MFFELRKKTDIILPEPKTKDNIIEDIITIGMLTLSIFSCGIYLKFNSSKSKLES